MSEERPGADLRGLEDRYEIRGELRGSETARQYIGRTKDERPAEVAITIARPSGGVASGVLSHYAADAQILAAERHPAIPRVLEARWIANDTIAVVSERVVGTRLDELLERGEHFPNPRIAMILQEVSAVLDWARENGVVHRGVTPESLTFEHRTNRVRISLMPTPVPISGLPDQAADARTIAMLAWAFLTGKPYEAGETRSIGEVCPNLALRVIEATDRMIRSKDHQSRPDVGTYLGIIAAGDVMKQAEVELAAQKEEYDEQHRIELQKCELHRQETEAQAAEQAAIFAGEREEFQRTMADERAAIAAERAQFEALMGERKERFAAVRAELDQQRAELERRLTELEQYRKEVEKVRDDALAAREAAKLATTRANEAAAAHASALKASAASAAAAMPAGTTPPADLPVGMEPIAVPDFEPLKGLNLAKPPKAPKWEKFEPVDLEQTDESAVSLGGRPRWMIPTGVATLLLIVVSAIYGATHRGSPPSNVVKIGPTTVVPTAPEPQTGIVPRGGFLTQSAGGALAPRFGGSPVVTRTDSAAAAVAGTPAPTTPAADSMSQAVRDSVAAIRARARRDDAAQEAELREARRRRLQAEADSMARNSSNFFSLPSRTMDSAKARRDSIRPDTLNRRR